MTLVPKNPTQVYPPGDGYGFADPRTGMKFSGLHGNPESTALKIIEHRRANPNLYPEGGGDVGSVMQEIYRQKQQTMPWLFIGGGDQPGAPASQPQASNVCSCGSTEFEPTYCASCGGSKINGYKCKKCGKAR